MQVVKWYCTMVWNRVPKKLWDYGIVWISEIHSMTHTSTGNRLKGAIPLEQVTGDTVDISEYLDFGFYDKVWYKDNAGLSPAMARSFPSHWTVDVLPCVNADRSSYLKIICYMCYQP